MKASMSQRVDVYKTFRSIKIVYVA